MAESHRQAFVDNLRRLWDNVGRRTKPAVNLDAFVQQLQGRIARADTVRATDRVVTQFPTLTKPSQRRPFRSRAVWYGTLGVSIASVAFVTLIAGNRPSPGTATQFTTYATTSGQRANIVLPDGSTVALNVASRLYVPVDYAAGNHRLRLDGEALFTVRHLEGTLFSVVAGAVSANVLGTSFAVRHYTTDTTTTVSVREGKVAVRSAVLTAVRQAVVNRQGEVRVQAATPEQFSFAAGVLTLNDVPFSRAIVEFDRWYDADIRLGDPALATRRLTGQCAAGSLADLVELLEFTFDVRVVRDGRVLTLYTR